MKRVLVAAAAGAVVALSGCSGGAGKGGGASLTPPAVTAAPTPSSFAAVTLPLDAYQLNDQQLGTVDRARNLLVQDCMRRKGFASWTPPPITPRVRQDGPGRFGFLDEKQAAEWGFHQPGTSATKPTDPPHADSPAEIAALGQPRPGATGRPEGCLSEAAQKLAEGEARGTDAQLVNTLTDEAFQHTLQDSQVRQATQAWSGCMKHQGYDYASPTDLATAAWGQGGPTPSEIAIAKADVACTRQTNLAGIALAVLAGYQRQLVDQHKQQLDAVKAGAEDQVRKAEQILAGQGR